jgi:hypothetical protein
MNSYEERQEARRERLQERAEAARKESERRYDLSKRGLPPMGEPIKVGHHSEGRHRRALDRSWQNMGKSVEASAKAAELEQRAASVGKGGISSDDPEAIAKLRRKLEALEGAQERMKAANKAYKKGGADALREIEPKHAESLLAGMVRSWCKDKPFPPYALTNNHAEIRRCKARIEELTKREETAPAKTVEGDGWRFEEDREENRFVFEFDGKPDERTRTELKSNGFKWSPYRGQWVRKITANGAGWARITLEWLQAQQ